MSAEKKYRDAKKIREELEHAKGVSDQILRIIGINPDSTYTAAVDFPGLDEARRQESEALEAWSKEKRSS